MRISGGALLVVLAMLIPFVVELRTALSWFGVELTLLETSVIGSAAALAIIAWAVWPPNDDANGKSSGLS
ncbi:CbaC protein [Natrinema halophilum]|uniref:CbaC protein n=1 Tax=Natrinema halophilum TaxID=1699371 RepID=A0A7D5KKZ9_9EURY|nr:CbaC protein [Natrinema halophilum]QLG50979.1 CbaC protein [Natrinema halophilum]